MDQAEPTGQDALGTFGERRKDAVMDSDKHISNRGIPEAAHRMSIFHIRNDASFGYISVYQNTCKRVVYQKVNRSKFQRTA
jgi:hypothetical protein